MVEKSLLRKIKTVLGLGGGSDDSPDESDAGVTIEREPAGDGTWTASDENASTDAAEPTTHDPEAEPSTAETTADSQTAETTADSQTAETTAAIEDSSDTGTATDRPDAGAGTEDPDAGAGTEDPDAAAGTEDPDSAAGAEPVDAVKGIGPTYSDRLADVGIETVDQLAEAEPEAVADAAKTGATKAGNWIERARNRRS